MKMTQAHYLKIETAINDVLQIDNENGELVTSYEKGEIHNADKTKDLQKRFCFDLLYATGLRSWVCSDLYQYLDDTHIYTALRKICPSVERKF